MDDTISRQQAIDALMEDFKRIPTNAIRAKIVIEQLPFAQPEDRCSECDAWNQYKNYPRQPEQRWIPCSENLPDGQGFYLVSVGAPYKTVRVYEYKPCEWYENENLWKKEDGSYCFNWFVEAWMPLPEPWREEGDS